MSPYALVSLIYLLAAIAGWIELRRPRESKVRDSRQDDSRAAWLAVFLLIAAWAWMIYVISTLRPASPVAALESLLHRLPGVQQWLLE